MKKEIPKIKKVIRKTSGGMHSWVEADVKGEKIIIRKPNNKL